MPDKNYHSKNFIIAGMLAIGLTGSPLAVSAGSNGGRLNEEHQRWEDAVWYSQDALVVLSRAELTYLANYRINGFYEPMASRVVTMMLSDRSSAQTLLRDMAKLDTKDKRKARLKAELQRVSVLDTASDHHLLWRGNNGYRQGVKAWLRYPDEGTHKSFGPFSISFDGLKVTHNNP